jgi:DNA-binding winged helix-turn-helix (wHTH) protein/tetratricopeptide (TPR) repeat protein
MIAADGPAKVDLAREAAFRVGALTVQPSTREVNNGDRRQALEPRIMQVLVVLARRRGEVVSRDELIATCWGGRMVVDEAIQRCVGAIRRLAESGGGFSVTTVARVGYRLDEASAPVDTTSRPAARRLVQPPSLVGRARQMSLLHGALDEALAGRGGLVLLAGEAGVGKSRLADEIGTDAARTGALVLTGHCREASSAPYTPFVEVLEETARKVSPEQFREALGEDAAQVAKIFPELRRRFNDIPPPIELPPDQERRYLFNSLRDYLERAARSRPLVLVLEDLHWADDATLGLLHHIADRLGEMSVLIVGTHRRAEHDIGRAFANFLEESVRRHHVLRAALRGFSEAETTALIRRLADRDFPRTRLVGADIAPAWVAGLQKATQGNPFFIGEVVRSLADDGRLLDAEGNLRVDISLSELAIPDDARRIVLSRMARLGDATREVLTVAAVIGEQFDAQLLDAVTRERDVDVYHALDEAESASLISGDAGGYRFTHDLVRQAVVTGLTLARRRKLHMRIADSIEQVFGPGGDEQVADLGRHLFSAGPLADPRRTVATLTAAGQRALRGAAFQEALVSFEAALGILGANPTSERAFLLYGHGQCCAGLDRRDEAFADLERAADIYELIGDTEATASVLYALADEYCRMGRNAEASEVCRRALTILPESPSGDRALLLCLVAYLHALEREFEASESVFDKADEIAAAVGDQSVASTVFDQRALTHIGLGESREAAALALKAVAAARKAASLPCLSQSLMKAAIGLHGIARWAEAEKCLDEGQRVAQLIADSFSWKHSELLRGAMDSARRGALFDEKDRAYLRNFSQDSSFRRLALDHLAWDDYRAGRWDDAIASFEKAKRLPESWSGLLLISARGGDRARAEALLAGRSAPEPEVVRRRSGGWERMAAIAEALVLLDRHEDAARFLPALSAHLQHQVICGGRLLDATVAVVAAAAGKWAEAERHFQTAIELADLLPHRFAQADVRQDWARALLRRGASGDRERACQLLCDAAERYEQMGMDRHRDVAKSILGDAQ